MTAPSPVQCKKMSWVSYRCLPHTALTSNKFSWWIYQDLLSWLLSHILHILLFLFLDWKLLVDATVSLFRTPLIQLASCTVPSERRQTVTVGVWSLFCHNITLQPREWAMIFSFFLQSSINEDVDRWEWACPICTLMLPYHWTAPLYTAGSIDMQSSHPESLVGHAVSLADVYWPTNLLFPAHSDELQQFARTLTILWTLMFYCCLQRWRLKMVTVLLTQITSQDILEIHTWQVTANQAEMCVISFPDSLEWL